MYNIYKNHNIYKKSLFGAIVLVVLAVLNFVILINAEYSVIDGVCYAALIIAMPAIEEFIILVMRTQYLKYLSNVTVKDGMIFEKLFGFVINSKQICDFRFAGVAYNKYAKSDVIYLSVCNPKDMIESIGIGVLYRLWDSLFILPVNSDTNKILQTVLDNISHKNIKEFCQINLNKSVRAKITLYLYWIFTLIHWTVLIIAVLLSKDSALIEIYFITAVLITLLFITFFIEDPLNKENANVRINGKNIILKKYGKEYSTDFHEYDGCGIELLYSKKTNKICKREFYFIKNKRGNNEVSHKFIKNKIISNHSRTNVDDTSERYVWKIKKSLAIAYDEYLYEYLNNYEGIHFDTIITYKID